MRRLLLLLLALGLGLAAGEYLGSNFPFRQLLGRLVRRSELLATVAGRGIYQSDLERAARAEFYLRGAAPVKSELLARLIELEKLQAAAARQPLDPAALAHEMELLHAQFRDEKAWNAALPERAAWRRAAAAQLRARAWLEAQLAGHLAPNEKAARAFYDAHPAAFRAPLRFRASHLFLAAPDGSPTAVIEAKRALITALALRLKNGESFPLLVAEFSEDEATKARAGDLNYFAEERMLPEIFRAAQTLPDGGTSAPLRSRLGFHILERTQALTPRPLSFAEAAPEIANALENAARGPAVAALVAQLGGKIEFAAQRD